MILTNGTAGGTASPSKRAPYAAPDVSTASRRTQRRLLRWRNTSVVSGQAVAVASYSVNPDGVAWARHLIDTGQYVLQSDWGKVQPGASEQNAFLKSHSWQEYARWHLGLTDGARDETKARYAFVYGDFRRLHRMGIIACQYRAAEWRHKDIEVAAHDLLQHLDARHP
jgi:hypothetical protein